MRTQRHFRVRRRGSIEQLESRRLLSLSPQGPEFLANSFTTGSQTAPAVATDADGDFVLVWTSAGQDGSGAGIYAQRFDFTGAPQGAEFRVNSFTTGDQTEPAVAMDDAGDFVVAWQSNAQDGSNFGIYAQCYDAAGAPQGGEFLVNTYTTNRQTDPAAAMDAAGNFAIVWQSVAQDGSGESIHGQRYDAQGAAQGSEFRVNTTTGLNQSEPDVAADDAGNLVVVWQTDAQDGSGTGVYAQRYAASGAAQGGEQLVNTFTTGNQRAPSVARDADGDIVVAWESYAQDGDHFGVFAQRFDAAGAPQGDEFRVNTTTAGNQSAPAVAMDAAGNFVVAWRSPDDNGTGVYLQGYVASGAPNDVELRANQVTSSVQTAAAVAMDADGDVVAAWQTFGQDGGGYGIYARRYKVLSGVVGSAFRFETAPHRLLIAFDDHFGASLGADDLVLQNLTTMQTIPAADLLVTYDLPTNTATFEYAGPGSGIAGVLPDGEYRATLLAAGVTNPGGNPLPDDYVREFFFLQADANHDGRADLSDFNLLAANFGQSPRDFTQGDFTYDGVVNLGDFNVLAARFGQFLRPVADALQRDTSRTGPDDPHREADDALDQLLT